MQQIDVEQQKKLKAYGQAKHRAVYFVAVPFGVILGILLALSQSFSFSGWFTLFNVRMNGILLPLRWQPVNAWYPLAIFFYYILLVIILGILYFPYAFYIGYVLRKRHKVGGMGTSARKYLWNMCKAPSKLVGMWAWRIEVLYLLLVIQPSTWWLWMVLIRSCELLLTAYIRPWVLARSFTVTTLPDGELAQRLQVRLKHLSTYVQRIIVIDKPGRKMQVNAYSIGWGRMRQIGVSSTMLNTFSLDETEVIMVHEIGHLVHHDFWRRLAIKTSLWIVSYFLVYRALIYIIATGYYYTTPLTDVTTLPLLLFCLGTISLYSTLTYNYFSRRHEYQADEFALQATGMIEPFKNAMIRLTNANRTLINGKSSTTHPSLMSRLQHADEFASRQQAQRSMTDPQQNIVGL